MNNRIIKILIPIVAIVIIFESIMLVSSLDKAKSVSETVSVTPVETKEEVKTSVVDLSFVSDTSEMKVGKSYNVSLNLVPKEDLRLNALDLFVKFDPEFFTISNLTNDKGLPKADLLKVSDKKDVLANRFLFTIGDGQLFANGKKVTVLSFTITPKKEGLSILELSTGDSIGDSVTMFVDKVTSKDLPFSSNRLEVNVIK